MVDQRRSEVGVIGLQFNLHCKPDGGTNVVVSVFVMRKADVRVILVFVTDHGSYLYHSVVDMFPTLASDGSGHMCSYQHVYGGRELSVD